MKTKNKITKNKIIVLINGSGFVGKDTFCEFCGMYIPAYIVSTVDKVKEAYRLFGWNEEKTEIHRKALSDIKDIATQTLDHPYNYIKRQINYFKNSSNNLMFIHVREPYEIERLKNDFGCITLLIRNPNIKPITSNHADAEVENYNYDYIIENDGDYIDLDKKAKEFVEKLFND